MAEVKWIKIATDIFDDEKILLIESMPESDALIVIWLKMLVLAGKCNNSGCLMMDDRIPYSEEMLSAIFRRPLNTIRLALSTFERFGMIEIINDVVTIPKWEKHQSLDKLEKMQQQNRERVRRHREKQKMLTSGNDKCNVTEPLQVMQSNAIDKDIDKDKELSSCSYTDVWKSLSSEEIDNLYETFKNAGDLIQVVYESVKLKRKNLDNPYNYIVGYAQNTGWERL